MRFEEEGREAEDDDEAGHDEARPADHGAQDPAQPPGCWLGPSVTSAISPPACRVERVPSSLLERVATGSSGGIVATHPSSLNGLGRGEQALT
jgi:hypothetical protein